MEKKASKMRFIGINLLIAVVIVLVIVVVVIIGLKNYTHHGDEIEVPQVTGLYPQEAEYLLGSSQLRLEIIDSTFSKKVPLGTIVEQTPPAESKVKRQRAVYVVINASMHKRVVLPELHDVSYRQAMNVLQQMGLTVGEVVYEPSEYRDLVLDLRIGEESLEVGSKVEEGSVITMVVGQGRGTEMMKVPDVGGLKLMEVRSLLLSQRLTVGKVTYDEEPTEENREEYVVYWQEPQAGAMLLEGSGVQIKLSLDKQKAITSENMGDDEEFF